MKLAAHPRLYAGPEHYAQLKQPPRLPVLAQAAGRLSAFVEKILADPQIRVDENIHNAHLVRARHMQIQIVSLLVQYKRTGERRFRDGLMENVRRMAGWEYWSWIAWRQNDARPGAIFDLSYGENAFTLAVVFDALCGEFSPEETQLFVETARRRALGPYLARNDRAEKEWWHSKPDTNWNAVCNGGAGMLALAMGELCPEAERVLELVEAGIAPYFEFLAADGAWPEGIGYWNYGMRYGYVYLLSHERATGRPHPLLERPATQASLLFPLAFTPNGAPCSFGDVNNFAPLPFHCAAAERYGRWDIIAELDRRLAMSPVREAVWPEDPELLLLHPAGRVKPAAAGELQWKNLALMAGLEWGYAADRMPRPSLYVAVRGGTTRAPHVHSDLMSFFCVVNDEALIDNIPIDKYYDTTFSTRRFELYEASAASKNTIFINGVSTVCETSVKTSILKGPGYEGFRLDATGAMGGPKEGTAPLFCGRVILLVQGRGVLIADRVALPHAGLLESRLHTFSEASFGPDAVEIRGKRERLHVCFAASQPAQLKRGMGVPTTPERAADTMIRYVSTQQVMAMTLCYFLSPHGAARVALNAEQDSSVITVSGEVDFSLRLSGILEPETK